MCVSINHVETKRPRDGYYIIFFFNHGGFKGAFCNFLKQETSNLSKCKFPKHLMFNHTFNQIIYTREVDEDGR